jgi:hypothetical protein
MIRFLADENVNADILDGLLRMKPKMELMRVEDVNLRRRPDPDSGMGSPSQLRRADE